MPPHQLPRTRPPKDPNPKTNTLVRELCPHSMIDDRAVVPGHVAGQPNVHDGGLVAAFLPIGDRPTRPASAASRWNSSLTASDHLEPV
jgi:hypothetical protein